MSKLKRKKSQTVKKSAPKQQPKKKSAIALYISSGLTLVLVVVLVLVFALKPKDDESVADDKFPDIVHLSVNQYKYLINQIEKSELTDEEQEALDESLIKHDIYIFVYNPNFEECQGCDEIALMLEDKFNKDDKDYTIFVINYNEHPEIKEQIEQNYLPDIPVLIHIQGEETKDVYVNVLAIKSELSKL